MPADLTRLRDLIADRSLLKGSDGGAFKLASGRESAFFFDMKQTVFDAEGANLIADAILDALSPEDGDHIGGLETGAIPVVAAVVQKSLDRRPLSGFFVRKQAKGTGTNKLIDGIIEPGARVILVEDVTTTGGSALKAAAAVREIGCAVSRIVTIVDRMEGAAAAAAAEGIPFTPLLTRDDFA